jgi:hypothetical protein
MIILYDNENQLNYHERKQETDDLFGAILLALSRKDSTVAGILNENNPR